MSKKIVGILSFMMILIVVGCQKTAVTTEEIIIPDCGYNLEYYYDEQLPIKDILIDNAKVKGNLDNFINVCKEKEINPITVYDSALKTYKIDFIFEHIFPLKDMVITNYLNNDQIALKTIQIDVSIDGRGFNRIKNDVDLSNVDTMETTIELDDVSAKYVRIVFSADQGVGNYGGKEFGLNDVTFHLGDGLIIEQDTEWENAFLRYEGWSGADGIFSFNLTNGHDYIGAEANTTGFVFSDTFVGSVYENNGLRKSSKIVNNTLGYYDGNENIYEGMDFVYKTGLNNVPKSVFEPTELIGFTENNLINGYGLDVYNVQQALLTNQAEGVMWLSETFNEETIIFDLETDHSLGSIYLWNYNEAIFNGIKDFELYYSNNNIQYTKMDAYSLEAASGSESEPYTKAIDLNGITARYIKIKILTSHQDNPNQVGLGKVMIFDEGNQYLFAKVRASSTDKRLIGNEASARLWLQDGVVIGNNFYVFPIIVKDDADLFKVFDVSMIKVPIVNEQFDYEQAQYFDTPLQSQTLDGGIIYYGAGLMNMSISGGAQNPDGYVYIYGYKDLEGVRDLVVARTLPEDIENFNSWEYYDGMSWSKDINDSYGLKTGVSAELSVNYISEGMFAGKYMLVVMEKTLSGKISYALSDTPYGPFSDYTLMFKTPESQTLKYAFTYNAKLHPHLSEPGNYLISYNVNSTKVSALQDVDIYRPRFIRAIEVKHR